MAKVHIGKKIKEIWKKSRLKGTEFAKLINRDRQVIYDIFKRESIDTELLQQISKALHHDFFSYYNANLTTAVQEPEEKIKFITAAELAQSNRELFNAFKIEINQLREELFLKKDSYILKAKTRKKK